MSGPATHSRAVLRSIIVVISIHGSVLDADDFQWRRIAWDDLFVNSVAVPRDSLHIVYATVQTADSTGVYKSYSYGASWQLLPESTFYWANILTVDPKNSAVIYCGSGCFLFDPGIPELYPKRSRDAGVHWETILEPLYRIVPSPWIEGLLMATKRPQEAWGLARSTDDGETWATVSWVEIGAGISDHVVFHLEDPLAVFSWVNLGSEWGLARSTDGGLEWVIVLHGIISAFDQDPMDADHWIAIEYHGQSEPARFAESFDNGESWAEWPLPDPILFVGQLSFDRLDPEVIYAVQSMNSGMGIYRSVDGGLAWAPMNDGFPTTDFTFEIHQTNGRPRRLLAARGDGL